nr:UDP-N-acetylmuramoyl-L-alanyl-D-glutamate--2,6-diaminopimelate ligase [Deltaproteobacteria bacterium]
MLLRSALPRLSPLLVLGDAAVEVQAVTRDSRQAGPGVVFVAVKGAKVDGHDLVPGLDCAAVIAEQPVKTDVPVVLVRDAKAALATMAAMLHGDPGAAMKMVGVTGTNGKTTVTTLLDGALRRAGVRSGRIGTTGNAIDGVLRPTSFTTPEAPELQALLAEMRDAGCAAVAMEVSSIGLAQRRVEAIPFHLGVFTNFTQDHLDFHGTMDEYAEAKARLFRALLRPAGGMPRALLCADDPGWRRMDPPADRWTYGFGPADLRAVETRITPLGTRLRVETPLGPADLHSRLVGRHNAANLLAALGSLLLLD